VLGVMLAWLITTGLGRLMSELMALIKLSGGLVVALSPIGVAGWLGISTAIAIASSLVPALSASRRSIREAVSYE
jgi:ABC-type lipoprotein release transport system permease subunit